MMEYWRQCALWLINCKVLPANHRVTWESAQVFDLAQTLRDGVLLCHLLNNLRPQSINLKEINLRPQMSQCLAQPGLAQPGLTQPGLTQPGLAQPGLTQPGLAQPGLFMLGWMSYSFLCLKNIRTFLAACSEVFGMKKSELFEAFDLFDVRDFGKLGKESNSKRRVPDEILRKHDLTQKAMVMDTLSKLSHTAIAQQPGLRPFPTEESVEDEDIYNHLEDLIDENEVEDEDDLYDCVYDDEDGGEIYEDLMKTEAIPPPHFMTPLTMFLSMAEMEKVFVNVPDLVKVHKCLLLEIQDSVQYRSAQNLYQIFITFKERLLIYGKYCSHVETAIATLDGICKDREDVRMKLEECSKRANYGKFTLRDLLVVPMQRVLKYHLLLQELVKHTHDTTDKSNLRKALDAMKDLAQYVNEVKRDNETLREIDQYQKSIENLNQPLSNYGRPKGDGEVRVASVDKRAKQDRHIFLFDAAVIVCKRRGDNYEMKEWSHGFYLTHNQGQSGFEFFFKTKELKKKWLEQFGMAISNIRPENATNNHHEFHMHTFERITSCNSCHMLLRCFGAAGLFKSKDRDPGLPKMLVIRNYFGVPSPTSGPALSIQTGDIIELICADLHCPWWQGKILSTKEVGFFPSDAVKPHPCVPKPVDYSSQPWFAGPMERLQAEAELINRVNSTYLVRHRSREYTEYAISIKYNNDVKHIKILTKEFCFYIAENKKFRNILVSVSDVTYTKVFTPKVIGVAIARYDFSSRDTRELSLQEGDVVKIYTKSGANGWWRGEVNGRVGWFPSTYVEEGEE
ncbi:hypothetical protein PAMP_011383 [Pampus punctatissimus]